MALEKTINGVNLNYVFHHPRILELRLSLFYTRLAKEYDYNKILQTFNAFSDIFGCDWKIMKGIFDSIPEIRTVEKRNLERFRQEVVFIGMMKGKTRYYVAEKYLNKAPRLLYNGTFELRVDVFLNEAWVKELDKHVALCGIPNYKREIEKFVRGLELFAEVI